MKKILTAVALTALIASPAMAKNARHYNQQQSWVGTEAYASADYNYAVPGDVIVGGQIVGHDPDPNVRLGILKQAETGSP